MQQRVFSAAGAARGPRIQRETPGAQGRQALFAASSAAQPAQGAPGAGLSRRLIGACEDAARGGGFARLRLRVRLELPENEALFARMGFARVGVEAHAGFDRPTVAIMEKPLP